MAGAVVRVAKGVAIAVLGASFYAGAPLLLATAPAFAQVVPVAPPANATAAQKADWARQAVTTLVAYYSDSSRITEGAAFSEAIQNLLLSNPTLAGELATVIIEIGDQTYSAALAGDAGGAAAQEAAFFVNPSLSEGLAKGLAYAVSTWQAQVNANPDTTPVQQAALAAVNAAFAAAELSRGSLFARTFALASSETGNGLLPPSLVDPDSPDAILQLTVLPPPKTTSNNVPVPSPNRPAI